MKKREQEFGALVAPPPQAVVANVKALSSTQSSAPTLEQVEQVVNSNLQSVLARIEGMLSTQTAFVQAQLQDIHQRLEEDADILDVDNHLDQND
eukprot:3831371-Amphidinium_carterae.1